MDVENLDPEVFHLVQKNTWGLYSGRCRQLIGGHAGDPLPETWLTNERAQRLIETGVPMADIIRKAKIAARARHAEKMNREG